MRRTEVEVDNIGERSDVDNTMLWGENQLREEEDSLDGDRTNDRRGLLRFNKKQQPLGWCF